MLLNILVTGAAGLIGGEVCARLCAAGHQVTALARRKRTIQGNDGAQVPVAKIVSGDVAVPRFGLDEDSWHRLARDNDLLIHCAAVTRFDLPEAQYSATNISGTAHAIDLARAGSLGLIHVGTAYVCGERSGPILETDTLPDGGFANAYEASKAVAERLVKASGLPFVIARPGIVVGDSRAGAIRDFESIYAMFKAIARGRIRTMPFRRDATLDLVPIDHVAGSIAALAGRFGQADGRTVHLVSGQPVTVGEFVGAIGSFPQFHQPDLVPAQDFNPARLPPAEHRLYSRLAAPYADYFQRDPRFDDRTLRAVTGLSCPPTGPGWLRMLMRYCVLRGFLPEDTVSEYRGNAAPAAYARPMPTSLQP